MTPPTVPAPFFLRVLQYQLPTVVLVCNFALPEPPPLFDGVSDGGGNSGEADTGDSRLMSHSDVETLFHEFGHALHSLLSRTELQHVSGERDFVCVWFEMCPR